VSCAAPDRTEACGRFVFNPTTRALEIVPAHRDKAAKAVMRELRRTKLRLYFAFAGLYCLKFALQSCSAVLRLLRKAARDFSNLILKDHGGSLANPADHGGATVKIMQMLSAGDQPPLKGSPLPWLGAMRA
jgi:hypothetical protein